MEPELTASATIQNGKLKEIVVTNNGSQYINNPNNHTDGW